MSVFAVTRPSIAGLRTSGRSAASCSCMVHSRCLSIITHLEYLTVAATRRVMQRMLTCTAVASGRASCAPVRRSTPICRLSWYGFIRSLHKHNNVRRISITLQCCVRDNTAVGPTLTQTVSCRPDSFAIDLSNRYRQTAVVPCGAQLLRKGKRSLQSLVECRRFADAGPHGTCKVFKRHMQVDIHHLFTWNSICTVRPTSPSPGAPGDKSPSTVCVLPLPVCPYVMIVLSCPATHDCTTLLMLCMRKPIVSHQHHCVIRQLTTRE